MMFTICTINKKKNKYCIIDSFCTRQFKMADILKLAW